MGRRLGQHFLFDHAILEWIARAACGDAAVTVIEIGPGLGGLTAHLLPLCQRLIAVELDPTLAAALRERFRDEPRFELIEGDVLTTDLAQWGRVSVAGNIPYYITSPIVERTLALGPLLERAVFLVQKEVADRLSAEPGSRDFGYLSVMTQLRCTARTLFKVKPGAFRPPPKVDSAVVALEPHGEAFTDDPAGFEAFASACFRQKRKTLKNNLAGTPFAAKLAIRQEAGMRAEQLSAAALARLFDTLKD